MTDANTIKMNSGPAQNTTVQPLILGNVNAANLLTPNATCTPNNVLIPTNVMTLPVSGTANQVIGILPIFIQSAQIPNSIDSSQVIQLNQDFNKNQESSNSTTGCVSSKPICHSSPVNVQPKLLSSDTLILPSSESKLASADTKPLISTSSDILTIKCSVEQLEAKQEIGPLQTAFSLVSTLSNKSVDLDSIPTMTLFKQETVNVNVTNKNQIVMNESINTFLNQSSSSRKISGVPSRRYETRSKTKNVINPPDGFQLEIDVDTDTEEDIDFQSLEGEKKENSLTRDDTIILPNNCQSDVTTQNNSPLAASDTLILSSDKSRFEPTMVTSTGIPIDICIGSSSTSHPNTILTVSGGNLISQPPLPSIPSIPSLMLTDSIVDGTVNPTLICDLLTQSSENSIQIQSLKSIALKQFGSIENFSLIPSLQSATQRPSLTVTPSQTSIQVVSSSTPVINSNQKTLPTLPLSTSVKCDQTDWILGNIPLSIIPNIIPQAVGGDANKEQAVRENLEEHSELETSEQQPTVYETNEQPGKEMHIEQLTEELPFPCADCEQKFSSKLELKKHGKTAHNQTLKCDLCNSTFTRLGNYKRHRKIHDLKPDDKRFTCSECGREFLQRCDLRRHLLIHSNQQPHRCEICNKGYIRHSDLVVHMRFHNKERNFKCNLCDKRYFQSGDLGRHIRRAHKPTSQLTCGHCARKYACEITLIRHMKVVHKDIILNSVIGVAQNK